MLSSLLEEANASGPHAHGVDMQRKKRLPYAAAAQGIACDYGR